MIISLQSRDGKSTGEEQVTQTYRQSRNRIQSVAGVDSHGGEFVPQSD